MCVSFKKRVNPVVSVLTSCRSTTEWNGLEHDQKTVLMELQMILDTAQQIDKDIINCRKLVYQRQQMNDSGHADVDNEQKQQYRRVLKTSIQSLSQVMALLSPRPR
ncbi:hypothetical protein NADFUDRAFT_51572 [Nadsonia fulvescens var. elongata DSM 6958]|uniref:Uncharacterized protein n=1 Tax=Nadsonia fulvescens var. elongata DSM 6958 TaxID=857566 RepID=A0A1E3PHT6_9ASCO|nr:hypothetical protein NADFUDRAFT_51572 [Nadsonia fulvescens var. elongata DSM 6958]